MDNGSKQWLAKSFMNIVAKSLQISVTHTIGIKSNAINELVLYFCDYATIEKEAPHIDNYIDHHHDLLMVIYITYPIPSKNSICC